MNRTWRIYTVMAANGFGEFFWLKDQGDRGSVGANLYSLMDAKCGVEPAEISPALFRDLCSWTEDYMAAQPKYVDGSWNLDWSKFNERGMQLAHRVKLELGSKDVVQYARAYGDPEGSEILLTLTE